MSIITCPNCYIPILIEAINCKVFRCGMFRINGEPINPHANKNECEYYINNNIIYGCGSPFYYDGINDPVLCEYQ